MAGPFRDSAEARVAMLEEENAALAEEVRELEARVPMNQDAFVKRLEEQRDEARRELEEIRTRPVPSPAWPAPVPDLQLSLPPEMRRLGMIVGAFVLGIVIVVVLYGVMHPRGSR